MKLIEFIYLNYIESLKYILDSTVKFILDDEKIDILQYIFCSQFIGKIQFVPKILWFNVKK